MHFVKIKNTDRTLFFVAVLAIVSVVGTSYLAYLNFQLKETLAAERTTATATQEQMQQTITEQHEHIASLENDRLALSENLEDERDRNNEFEDQIEEITGTVGQLDKLAKIDPELLQKYSKVFFLNEHFTPPELEQIDRDYVYDESKLHFLDERVVPFFEDMVEDAERDGVQLWVVSAYRSFDYQNDLKGQYTITYGTGANAFSADQGYSEHQLGTTVDFTTEGLGGGLQGFQNTEAYAWLEKNAYKYGFVLSYPQNNGYYIFEPWHWRFVGTDLADDLNDDDEHFYDLDQREIDEYLISLFD